MKQFFFSCMLWASVALSAAQAQINAKVEDFSLTNLTDGKSLSLNAQSGAQIVVLVFVSAYCPYSKSYQPRLLKMAQQFAAEKKPVVFLFINPENAQDTAEMMKDNLVRFGGFPYLLDKDQTLAAKLQATKTPEAFVLQKNLGHFFLKYQGAIDDNPQVAEEVSRAYLQEAIETLLKGGTLITTTTKPVGCLIKK